VPNDFDFRPGRRHVKGHGWRGLVALLLLAYAAITSALVHSFGPDMANALKGFWQAMPSLQPFGRPQ
jgi:hypothetical protein